MPPVDTTLKVIDQAAAADFRWWFVALLVIGLLTVFALAKYFTAQISALQKEISEVRTEYQTHLKTGNSEMILALSKSSDAINQNSRLLQAVATKAGLVASATI